MAKMTFPDGTSYEVTPLKVPEGVELILMAHVTFVIPDVLDKQMRRVIGEGWGPRSEFVVEAIQDKLSREFPENNW